MILRSLASAIRRQDWFTIAIEFVIVVAGIIVGLQVTEWNELRQLRERESNYLQRLAEDVGSRRAEIAEIQARAAGRPGNALRAFRRFGKGRYPAGPNYSDCYSYALAQVCDEALLFTGGDFERTDVRAVGKRR